MLVPSVVEDWDSAAWHSALPSLVMRPEEFVYTRLLLTGKLLRYLFTHNYSFITCPLVGWRGYVL